MTTHYKNTRKRISKMARGAIFPRSWYEIATTMTKGLCCGLLAASFTPYRLCAAQLSASNHSLSAIKKTSASSVNIEKILAALHPKKADFKQEIALHEVRHLADWVVDSGDNQSMPFVIVDKREAKVFVFHADGRLRGAAPALLGLAKGDAAIPGIGNRALSSIRPEERTTPAGRFVASLGRNMRGVEILWVDYGGAVSMHRVVTSNPKERRLERLATPTPLDNRISYGCINISVPFYNKVVHPAFNRTNGIVYILPETRTASELFGSYDVEEHARQQIKDPTTVLPPPKPSGK